MEYVRSQHNQAMTHMVSDINSTGLEGNHDTAELPLCLLDHQYFSSACHSTLAIPVTPGP